MSPVRIRLAPLPTDNRLVDMPRPGWLRSTASARVLAPLVVILLSVAGFLVTTRAVSDERRNAAHRRADLQAHEVQGQLERARAFAIGLANALEGERTPSARRFTALAGRGPAAHRLTPPPWGGGGP